VGNKNFRGIFNQRTNYREKPMTEIIYLTMITTTLLMISFYTGRMMGRKDVCNAIEVAVKKLEEDPT
jgi:hypothetical protein